MSGVSPVAIRGTPTTATMRSEAVAAKLQTMTLVRSRRSMRPVRSTGMDRSSIAAAKCGSLISSRASTALPALPRRSTSSGDGKASRADHTAIPPKRRRRRHIPAASAARARHRRHDGRRRAIEKNSASGNRCDVNVRRVHIPPTLSASARPSPTGEAASPAARDFFQRRQVRDIHRFDDAPPQAELDGRLIDGRVAERDGDIGDQAQYRRDDFIAYRIESCRRFSTGQTLPAATMAPAARVKRAA